MADLADVAQLRRLTDEPTTDNYSQTDLSEKIDRLGSVKAAAGEVWLEKASKFSGLVDVTEGSSSRKMSQLKDNALQMAAMYLAASGGTTDPRPHSRAIVRG